MSVIRGALWGLVLGGAGVSVASVLGPQPAGNAPPQSPPLVDAPETVAVTEPATTAPAPPSVDEDQPSGVAPQVTAPEPQPPALGGDIAPLAPPQAEDVAVVPEAPAPVEAPALAAETESPVLPTPQTRAPVVPQNEENLVVDTSPPQPVMVDEPEETLTVDVEALPIETPPVIAAEESASTVAAEDTVPSIAAEAVATTEADAVELASAETADSGSDVDLVVPAPADVAATVTNAAPTPVEPSADGVATLSPQESEPDAAASAEAEVAEASQPEPSQIVSSVPTAAEGADTEQTAAQVGAETAAPADDPVAVAQVTPNAASPIVTPDADVIAGAEVVDDTPQPEADAPDPAVTEPEDEAEPEAPVVVNLIDGARTGLPQGNSTVRINRVGASAEAPAEDAVEEVEPPATGVPLVDFAAAFDNPDGKPLLSVVLLDQGDIPPAPTLVAQLPFAVTVLVDAGGTEAAAKMAAYREAGVEVGAALRLPEGATATDVEVALEAARASLGEAVLVTDLGTADRAARDQMILALASEGRGFLSFSAGLSNGLREADAAGVPAVAVFRDLDPADQNARVIGRFLDQAAFRARQNSGVVLFGRIRSETLSALAVWGGSNKSDQVAMAPVSAVLTADD